MGIHLPLHRVLFLQGDHNVGLLLQEVSSGVERGHHRPLPPLHGHRGGKPSDGLNGYGMLYLETQISILVLKWLCWHIYTNVKNYLSQKLSWK